MASKPPLGLSVVMRGPTGAETTWWSGAPRPGDRPTGINWRTERGSGFLDAGCTLSRDVRGEYVDLGPLNEVVIVDDTGEIAYEGNLVTGPRSVDTSGHTISPTFIGPVALAQDRTFSEIYADHLLSNWGPMSLTRKATNLTALRQTTDGSVGQDATNNLPALINAVQAPWANAAISEALYDAGDGPLIGAIYYDFLPSSTINPATWQWSLIVSQTDDQGGSVSSGNIAAASGSGYYTPTTPGRYGWTQLYFNAANNSSANNGVGYELDWRNLVVYGTHGLTRHGSDPGGFYLTDILKDVFNRFAPQIDTSGVVENTTLIEHYRVDSQTPHATLLDLNKFSLWETGVWEGKRLQFEPADLTGEADWHVRISDPGFGTSLSGDDARELRNGIAVQFTEAGTGKTRLLTPDNYPELRDDSVENPANEWGRTKWGDPLVLSFPCTENMAIAAGQVELATSNAPKEAGQINVTGHVRDRQGNWQPAHRMRSGQTISIDDFPNSRARRIGSTQYDHDSYTATVATEGAIIGVETLIDYLMAEQQVANLAA